MKKITHYLPHIIFALLILALGVFGNYFGNELSVYVFNSLASLGAWGYVLRGLLMLTEIFAALGVFFIATRRIAASAGIAIMLVFIFLSLALAQASPMMPVITIVVGIWILFMGYGCDECTDGSCMVCKVEEPLAQEDIK